jgi:hypothetical protein
MIYPQAPDGDEYVLADTVTTVVAVDEAPIIGAIEDELLVEMGIRLQELVGQEEEQKGEEDQSQSEQED